jgi:SAM-dependent methyltransferase
MTTTYAQITRDDPNPVKRWLQDRRLVDATRLLAGRVLGRVVDYGGGDGALTLRLLRAGRSAEVRCFEPTPQLRAEAQDLLRGAVGASLVATAQDLPDAWADTAFCLEVFEHLPPAETQVALDHLHRVLRPDGRLVIGVPVEIGPPALAKGLFRMARRLGAFDARPGAVLAATLGRPPRVRQEAPIGPGLAYYPHHLGFDHRVLLARLGERFEILGQSGSPFGGPAAFNSELYILARKRDGATSEASR